MRLPLLPGCLGRPGAARPAAPLVLAAGSGAALALATPPVGWWPLALLGPGLLLLAVTWGTGARRYRRAYLLATGAALVYLLPVLHWAAAPGAAAWLGLALAEALMFGLLGPALLRVRRLPGYPVWAGLLWVADEALRDRVPFGGFPWARLAFTQPHTPFTPLAALGGAPLVSAAVAVTGSLLAAALCPGLSRGPGRGRSRRPGRWRAWAPVVLIVTLVLLVPVTTVRGGSPRSLRIAVVQGNVPEAHPFAAERDAGVVLATHLAETAVLTRRVVEHALPQPQLVIWPEDSVNLDPLADLAAGRLLDRAARQLGNPLLIGAVLLGPRPGTRYNASMLWGSQGPLGPVYLKRHPVPFGEYLPFRAELAPLLPQLTRLLPKDFLPGHHRGLLPVARTTVGDVICFEVAYDGLVRDTVTGGAQLVVVQTNNATFGRSGESAQQVAMAQLRAVEHDRSVVVASTVGISAVISPAGAVVARTAPFTAALLTARVPLIHRLTLTDRLGGLPEGLLTAAGLVALLAAGAGLPRPRPRPRRSCPEHGHRDSPGLEGWSLSAPTGAEPGGVPVGLGIATRGSHGWATSGSSCASRPTRNVPPFPARWPGSGRPSPPPTC